MSKPLSLLTALVLLAGPALLHTAQAARAAAAPQFSIQFPSARSAMPLDGRLLLLLSTDPSAEPRMQVDHTPKSQLVFGVDVDGLGPGKTAVVDARADGYPVRSLSALPAGTYTVQALLNRYETFHRADGHTVKLPPDRGEGQHWNLAPGNLYSKPVKLDVRAGGHYRLVLDQVIAPLETPADTRYIRRIRIQSALLTAFWGRPMTLSAVVLVPEGFDEHPQSHYPLMVFHDHYTDEMMDFRVEPPDERLKPDYSDRFHIAGYNRIVQQEAHKNFLQWISPGFPRFLVVKLQHANPYYDDSYAVNSANLGPYGDAIETELIPAIERQFRAIGQPWARFLYGGSTGGWESLAAQIFYPDHYNGAFGACPDPVDFRAYTHVDLYADDNAFFLEGAHKRVPQPAMRDYLGHNTLMLEDNQAYELALGSHGRSGEQFDIWQAVYGPVGRDGYPQPIFDKRTGVIDHAVAAYWREHYDLRAILARDWATLGPKLRGKLHLYCGSMDNYFLNDAVYLMEDFLKTTTSPPYDGEVRYGDRAEHCWNGDPDAPNHLSRLHYDTMYLPKILKRIEETAPAGADLTSWRY